MKSFLQILLLFSINVIVSQINTVSSGISFPEKIVFDKAIIHFTDNTSIEGLGRLKTIFSSKEDVIIFKVEQKDNPEEWTVKEVKGITIISDDGAKDYEYLKVTKNSFAELYEVVTEGTVKLYKKRKDNYSSFDIGNTAFTNEPLYNNFDPPKKAFYYLKKETEPYPTKIKDNYIKVIAEYMKDCDVIVDKIKNHEYNYSQLKDLVDYYNANCGND